MLPLRHAAPGNHGIGANIAVTASADVVLEDLHFSSTRSGMTVLLAGNVGPLARRRVNVDFSPGSDRLITSWKDGVHCKGNRVGPTIEGNSIDGLGGSGVWLGNEIGSFYEGPFPARVTVRGNVIRATQGPAIVIRTHLLRAGSPLIGPIDVLDNDITVLPGRPAVAISRGRDVRLVGNRIHDSTGAVPPQGGIEVTAAVDVTVEPPRE